MSYSYKCYSDTKDIMKKYVNAVEGAAIYGVIQHPWCSKSFLYQSN